MCIFYFTPLVSKLLRFFFATKNHANPKSRFQTMNDIQRSCVEVDFYTNVRQGRYKTLVGSKSNAIHVYPKSRASCDFSCKLANRMRLF